MAVHYLRFGGVPFQRTHEDLIPGAEILFFDPVLERGADSVGARYRRLDPHLRHADLLVLRGSGSGFLGKLLNDGMLKELIGSQPAVALVGADSLGQQVQLQPIAGSPKPLPAIKELRQVEVVSILERNEAIFSGKGYHFLLPSGVHADRFIRLGDALRDRVDVARFADWLQEFIDENTAVFGDTGTMLPILLELRARSGTVDGRTFAFDALDEYPREFQALPLLLDELRTRAGPGAKLLFLVSVNASGGLSRALHREDRAAKVIVVCDTGEDLDGIESLAKLKVNRWIPGANGHCLECEQKILTGIDFRTYERLPHIVPQPIQPAISQLSEHGEFWKAADRMDAVRLHHWTSYAEGAGSITRHHAVFIDIPKLLQDVSFRARCLQQLRTGEVPQLILIPMGLSEVALRDLATEAFPKLESEKAIVFVEPGKLAPKTRDRLVNQEQILVLDDAIVTGAVLRGLRDEIYEATHARSADPNVRAFAVVCRTPSDAAVQTLKRKWTSSSAGRSQIHWSYRVYLPAPGPEECPWCRERQLWFNYIGELEAAEREVVEARIRKLEREIAPPLLLEDNLLDPTTDVTVGSYLGNLRPAAAFAAASSVAQEVRGALKDAYSSDRIEVVDTKWIFDCFYDPIIHAGFLRTIHTRQLRWPGQDASFEGAMSGFDPVRSARLLPELVWAAIGGKLPNRQIEAKLSTMHSPGPILKILTRLLRRLAPPAGG